MYYKFDMKYLGVGKFILGIEIKKEWERMKLWLNKRKYVQRILWSFNMQECKLVQVPLPISENLFVDQ